jgi:hypothetical protein
MAEKKNIYRIIVAKHAGKIVFRRLTRTLDDKVNI